MFQLQFHWYGFFIGLALVIGFSVTEQLLKKKQVPSDLYWQLVITVLVAGLIGSRAWHVATDYQAYVGNWANAFAIWHGGLSIIGTIAGAVAAFFLFFAVQPKWKKYQLEILDSSVYGLALGQAIGRLGNYVNQELYGLPSKLPWSIYIDSAHRISGFEQFSTFHPLFAYEAILLLLFVGMAWKMKDKITQFGGGMLFITYIAYYSWIRFALDFLRIDKALSPFLGLGVNQIFLLLTAICSTIFLLKRFSEKKYEV